MAGVDLDLKSLTCVCRMDASRASAGKNSCRLPDELRVKAHGMALQVDGKAKSHNSLQAAMSR